MIPCHSHCGRPQRQSHGGPSPNHGHLTFHSRAWWGRNLHQRVTIPSQHPPVRNVPMNSKPKKHGENTETLINWTSAVNQNEHSKWLFNFLVRHTGNVPPGTISIQISNHQSKHSLFQFHSTGAANLEGNESTTFSFCWAQDFPTFLKKETASQDEGEVMSVNLLQSKLSPLESAPAVSLWWISSSVARFRLSTVAKQEQWPLPAG